MKGFTLIEFILVLAIFFLVIGLGFSFHGYFQMNRTLDLQQQSILRALRLAQNKAQSGLDHSHFGVSFQASQYVLFKGPAYSIREEDYDLIYNLPNNINISGISEIVFSPITGQPSLEGQLIITAHDLELSRIISINSLGLIQTE